MTRQTISKYKDARSYAFFLLKFRMRSENELYQRLKQKKFPEQTITETITFLKGKGFLDDKAFVKTWIESRINRPLGLRKLSAELKSKGVDKNIISAAIEEVKQQGYIEEEVVRELTQKKLKTLKGIEPDNAKRRIFAYLIRRGFSPDIVMDVVNQL